MICFSRDLSTNLECSKSKKHAVWSLQAFMFLYLVMHFTSQMINSTEESPKNGHCLDPGQHKQLEDGYVLTSTLLHAPVQLLVEINI